MREFGEILGKSGIVDGRSMGSKGLMFLSSFGNTIEIQVSLLKINQHITAKDMQAESSHKLVYTSYDIFDRKILI